MALIIKGKMPPKGKCWWHDEQGKEHECQFFPCDAIYCLDPEDRKEKCLIIGEIPDIHGRLIDADKLLKGLSDCEMKTYGYNGTCDECEDRNICRVRILLKDIEDAPTVLETTDGN